VAFLFLIIAGKSPKVNSCFVKYAKKARLFLENPVLSFSEKVRYAYFIEIVGKELVKWSLPS